MGDGFSVYAVGTAEGDIRITEASLAESEISVGDTADVDAVVENVGDDTTTTELDLLVDGEVIDTQEVTLDAGDSRTVRFTRTFDEAGSYDVAVDGVSAGTLEVTADEPDEAGGSGLLWGLLVLVLLAIATVGGYYYYQQTERGDV
jgi:hypothetical protein